MKNIIYILIIGLCSYSCDVLDVTPENSVTYTNYFQTEDELESIIYNMMGDMRAQLFSYPVHERIGALADGTTYTNIRNLLPSAICGTNFSLPQTDWSYLYNIVYDANVLLDNLHRATEVSSSRLNFYRGQACFGKGITYFFIARRWGNAIITQDSKTTTAYGNSPILEVIDTAISNGLQAFNLLPVYESLYSSTGTTLTSKQYGCKGSAAALLAHAYAWKGSIIELYGLEGDAEECYRQAIFYASEILEGRAGGSYGLLKPEALCEAMSVPGANNPESIFEIEIDELSASSVQYYGISKEYITYPVNKKATAAAVQYLAFRLFKTTVDEMYSDNDLRKAAYFYTPTAPVQTTYVYPYKWRNGYYVTQNNYERYQTLFANNTYWRISGLYLLRAECYAKLGDAQAISDLNTVRQNVGADLYPAAGESDIQLAVFREREKELLMEDHRYYDVIRNGKEYIRRELGTAFSNLTDQDILDGALYLPINNKAFNLNKILRQNVYWARVLN